MKTISTKDIISGSWDLFKNHWGFLWGVVLILIVVSATQGFIESTFTDEEGFPKISYSIVIIYTLISVFISIILNIGLINVVLGLIRGAEVKISHLIGDYKLVIPFFLGGILYGLVVLGGLILLIVPGIIWSLKYSQMFYLIVDKRMGVMDAFRKSGEMTYGSKLDIAIVGLAMMLLIILSALPLGLGLLVTIPMMFVFQPLIYNKLLMASEKPQDVPTSFDQGEQVEAQEKEAFEPLSE